MDLNLLGLIVLGSPLALILYGYAIYPASLWLLQFTRRSSLVIPKDWEPRIPITIVVIAYNEAANIRGTIERLLELEYPRDLRQILVVSDCSSDGTDDIVREYADRGVELVRMATRGGKTLSENRSLKYLRGEIIVNTDAAVRVARDCLAPLLRPFDDGAIGLTSGRDISTPSAADESNAGEGSYVGYEMWVRRLESRNGGIIGASGCLFAIRRELHMLDVPTDSLRDFAAPMFVRRAGFRSVSVDEAICYVPRTPNLRAEYRRKVRTHARGMHTLVWQRALLNPLRDPLFAWKLWSHKVVRWAVPVAALAALGVAFVAGEPWLRSMIAVAGLVAWSVVLAVMRWPTGRAVPRPLAVLAGTVASNAAVIHALGQLMRGDRNAIWEPTRRHADHATGSRP